MGQRHHDHLFLPPPGGAGGRRLTRRVGAAALLLYFPAFGSALEAQHPPCLDRGGRPVAVVPSDSLPYAAWATLTDSGQAVVYWNAGRMLTASPAVRLQVFLHECAHHVLAHVQKLVPNDVKREFERQADCWAIQKMVEEEMISALDLRDLMNEVGGWAGDRTHLAGPALALTMRECLAAKTASPEWYRFLDALSFASVDSLAPLRGDLIPESGDELVREAIMDAPGVYDCDIRGGYVLVCPLYGGVRPEPVLRRYRETREILASWLGEGWQFQERDQEGFEQSHMFLAWHEATGMNLALVVTNTNRLFFTWSALRPEP